MPTTTGLCLNLGREKGSAVFNGKEGRGSGSVSLVSYRIGTLGMRGSATCCTDDLVIH